jgi:hypothetical protein
MPCSPALLGSRAILFLLDAIHEALQQAIAAESTTPTPVPVETPSRVLALLKAHPEIGQPKTEA